MKDTLTHQQSIADNGYAIIEDVFSNGEVKAMTDVIEGADNSSPAFRKTKDLYAIRRFLKELPAITPLVFSVQFRQTLNELFGDGYFVVKSIYFDKPGESNWFVSYHQDLTISVSDKAKLPGYIHWSVKQDQFSVQPPLDILTNNFTIRIHLDDTDETNGALRIVPGSHLKEIYRPEHINWQTAKEITCYVPKGGIMIMKPLLLHASARSTGNRRRRVIHIEFSNASLPAPLLWSEA